MFDQILATSTPFLKNLLRNAERIIPVGSQGNWSYRSQKFYAERTVNDTNKRWHSAAGTRP